MECNMCYGKLKYIHINGTHIWSCEECPNIQFEYYKNSDLDNLQMYLNDEIKYMLCNIQFKNEKEIETVYIKCGNEMEEEEYKDEKIFYYGMRHRTALNAIKNKVLLESEWRLIEILEVMRELD